MPKSVKHPVDVHVGKKIRQLRHFRGLTQQELAAIVGVKFQQIQKYETGVNRVSASRLWDIARAFKVKISIFYEDLSTSPGDIAAIPIVGRDAAKVAIAFEIAPTATQAAVWAVLRAAPK